MYGEKTIELLNKDTITKKEKITDADEVELLLRVFCTTNCTQKHKNNGSMNGAIALAELDIKHKNVIQPPNVYGNEINTSDR